MSFDVENVTGFLNEAMGDDDLLTLSVKDAVNDSTPIANYTHIFSRIKAISTRNSTLAAVSVINTLIVFLHLAFRSKMKLTTKLTVMNLLAGSIINNGNLLVYGVAVQTSRRSHELECKVSIFFIIYGFLLNHAAVTGISLKTFLAVFSPLKYKLFLSTKTVLLSILLSWAVLLIVSVLSIGVGDFPGGLPCIALGVIPRYGCGILACVFAVMDFSAIVMNTTLCKYLVKRNRVHAARSAPTLRQENGSETSQGNLFGNTRDRRSNDRIKSRGFGSRLGGTPDTKRNDCISQTRKDVEHTSDVSTMSETGTRSLLRPQPYHTPGLHGRVVISKRRGYATNPSTSSCTHSQELMLSNVSVNETDEGNTRLMNGEKTQKAHGYHENHNPRTDKESKLGITSVFEVSKLLSHPKTTPTSALRNAVELSLQKPRLNSKAPSCTASSAYNSRVKQQTSPAIQIISVAETDNSQTVVPSTGCIANGSTRFQCQPMRLEIELRSNNNAEAARSPVGVSLGGHAPGRIHSRSEQSKFRSLTVSMVIICFSSCVLNVPFSLFMFYIALIADNRMEANFSTFGMACTSLIVINAFCDPVIYVWRFVVPWKKLITKIKSVCSCEGQTSSN